MCERGEREGGGREGNKKYINKYKQFRKKTSQLQQAHSA